MSNNIGIYIHIPFCKSKCPYCDFYSVPFDITLLNLYVSKVCGEISRWSKKTTQIVDTIYFGGGTPSLIGAEKICKILNEIKKCFVVEEHSEITVEVNPADYNTIDFEYLKKSGVNRLSVGAQSLSDEELHILGRRHGADDIISTIAMAQKSKFENISIDLILGISSQTQSSLEKSLFFCKEKNISHISAYMLKIEKNTPYFKLQRTLNLPDDDQTADLFLFASQILNKFGYNHYEISNFATLGKESHHNLKYWNLEEYLGIGPSAHSLINNQRFYYENSIYGFLQGNDVVFEDVGGTEKEYIMLQLRLESGLKNQKYKDNFGCDIPRKYYKKLEKYAVKGLVLVDNKSIKLTEPGFLLSNSILAEILGYTSED